MKRNIFIIAFLILLIGIPILTEASDSLAVKLENPILQSEKVKLPWYKDMNYTLGYNTDRSSLTSDGPNKDTLKAKNISFLRRLSYSIGYSGCVCYTGRDLMKYTDFDPLAFANPSNYLYWLNSVEASAIYPLGNKKGIEVGMGYEWASIRPRKYYNWEFKLPIIFLGYKQERITLKGKYIFIIAKDYGKVSGSTSKEGKGNGVEFVLQYKINRYIGLILRLGGGSYSAKEYFPNHISEYIVKMCFNGIGLSLKYNFKLKGGIK
jgi:hypothetical protein